MACKTFKSRHGFVLTPKDRKLLDGQDCCQICGSKERLNIDHDHKTNKVRGKLCMQCNQAIGKFKEKKSLLLAAIDYIEKHSNASTKVKNKPIQETI